jgi:hypothetical protein
MVTTSRVLSTGAKAVRDFTRLLPEPRNGVARGFHRTLKGVAGALSGETVHTLSPEYEELLQTQMEFQRQMQVVSLRSNSEKSKHEARMAAIRNVRTS